MKLRTHRAQNLVQVDSKSRRMFLKSAAGMTLSLPFLSSLLLSESSQAATTSPLRYVQLMTPHGGLLNKNWFGSNLPTTNYSLYSGVNARVNSLSSLVGSAGLSPVLGTSFNNLWPSINILAGLDQPVYFGHNRIVGIGAFALNNTSSLPSDQRTLTGLIGETPSIDQVMGYAGGNGIYGSSLGSRQRFVNIKAGLGMGDTGSWGRNNYANQSDLVIGRDTINSTAGVFSSLFGSLPTGTTTTAQSTNPLLNLVNEFWPSGKSLMNQLSVTDRNLLDQLFQMAQDSSKNYAATTSGASLTCSSTKPANTSTGWDTNGAGLQALADIIAMAFKCDLTRVVSIFVGDGIVSQNWHDLAHNSATEASQTELIKIHKQMADSFVARLGNNLMVADPLDSSSTILDNSLTLWTHENKAEHDNWSTPTLLMGGAGRRINTGLFADLRDLSSSAYIGVDACGDQIYQGELINRLWVSMFYAMGINKADYEVQRGGGTMSKSINTGYGHILINPDGWHSSPKSYNITKFAEPWEFLMKSSTVWG